MNSVEKLIGMPESSFRQEDLDFFARLKNFSNLVGKFDVEIEPYSRTGVSKFKEMSLHGRSQTIRNFTQYADLLEGAAKNGINLRHEKEVLTYVLARVGLTASDSAMDLIEDGHIIEIYTAEHIQIFRNIEFMQYCNYSLLDLLTFTFFDLYERAALVTNKLLEASSRIFSSDIEVLDLRSEFPHHVLRQRFAEPKAEIELDMRYLWPLFAGPENRKGLLSMSKVVRTSFVSENSGSLKFL